MLTFPNAAAVSFLFDVDERRTVEVAKEGNEGAVGLAIYLGGVNSCNLSRVRHAGTATRLSVSALAKCTKQRGDLQDLLHLMQPIVEVWPASYHALRVARLNRGLGISK